VQGLSAENVSTIGSINTKRVIANRLSKVDVDTAASAHLAYSGHTELVPMPRVDEGVLSEDIRGALIFASEEELHTRLAEEEILCSTYITPEMAMRFTSRRLGRDFSTKLIERAEMDYEHEVMKTPVLERILPLPMDETSLEESRDIWTNVLISDKTERGRMARIESRRLAAITFTPSDVGQSRIQAGSMDPRILEALTSVSGSAAAQFVSTLISGLLGGYGSLFYVPLKSNVTPGEGIQLCVLLIFTPYFLIYNIEELVQHLAECFMVNIQDIYRLISQDNLPDKYKSMMRDSRLKDSASKRVQAVLRFLTAVLHPKRWEELKLLDRDERVEEFFYERTRLPFVPAGFSSAFKSDSVTKIGTGEPLSVTVFGAVFRPFEDLISGPVGSIAQIATYMTSRAMYGDLFASRSATMTVASWAAAYLAMLGKLDLPVFPMAISGSGAEMNIVLSSSEAYSACMFPIDEIFERKIDGIPEIRNIQAKRSRLTYTELASNIGISTIVLSTICALCYLLRVLFSEPEIAVKPRFKPYAFYKVFDSIFTNAPRTLIEPLRRAFDISWETTLNDKLHGGELRGAMLTDDHANGAELLLRMRGTAAERERINTQRALLRMKGVPETELPRQGFVDTTGFFDDSGNIVIDKIKRRSVPRFDISKVYYMTEAPVLTISLLPNLAEFTEGCGYRVLVGSGEFVEMNARHLSFIVEMEGSDGDAKLKAHPLRMLQAASSPYFNTEAAAERNSRTRRLISGPLTKSVRISRLPVIVDIEKLDNGAGISETNEIFAAPSYTSDILKFAPLLFKQGYQQTFEEPSQHTSTFALNTQGVKDAPPGFGAIGVEVDVVIVGQDDTALAKQLIINGMKPGVYIVVKRYFMHLKAGDVITRLFNFRRIAPAYVPADVSRLYSYMVRN